MKERACFDEAPLPHKFKVIGEGFERRFNEDLRENDITSQQAGVLFFLHRNRGRKMTAKDICDGIHVQHPTMVGILNRMEEKGLIARQVDPECRRSRIITLTGKADEFLVEGHRKREARDADLLRGLTAEEVDTLNRALAQIYKNLCEDRASREKAQYRQEKEKEK